MEKYFAQIDWLLLVRLFLATVSGIALGWERRRRQSFIGIKTNSIVCLGACLVACVQINIFEVYNFGEPARLTAQVVSGIGFLGAGVIMKDRSGQHIYGITTAAMLWVSAIIGLAIGYGYLDIALFTVVIVLLINVFFD